MKLPPDAIEALTKLRNTPEQWRTEGEHCLADYQRQLALNSCADTLDRLIKDLTRALEEAP